MRTLKERFSTWLMQWLMKNQPEELRSLIKEASDAKAQSVALQTTMLYLDRLGLGHCALCPQRFGLRRTAIADGSGAREVYLCNAHYSEALILTHSNGNGAKTKLEAL